MSCTNCSSKRTVTGPFGPTHEQTWITRNLHSYYYDHYKSDIFRNVHSLTKWHVEMGYLLEREGVYLYLCHHASGNETVVASYAFDVQEYHPFNVQGVDVDYSEKSVSENYLAFNGDKKCSSVKFDRKARKKSSFIIKLELREVLGQKSTDKSLQQESSLLSAIKRMWEGEKFCDLVISVEGKDIPVHRVVLAGASPVFEAMLEQDKLEKSTHKMVIKDYTVEVVENLLQFAYTRKDLDFESFSLDACIDLLRAANQYDMANLVSIISRYLTSKFSIENVAEVLLVADQLNIADLKENAIDFICLKDVKLSEKDHLNKLEGNAELWREIALKKMGI